jgi:single-strand DNA-binding protein
MPALNRVQLIGYLGKDPESRFTPSGKKVTQFSLGVTRRWKSGSESKEATEWVNVEVWERLADVCQ